MRVLDWNPNNQYQLAGYAVATPLPAPVLAVQVAQVEAVKTPAATPAGVIATGMGTHKKGPISSTNGFQVGSQTVADANAQLYQQGTIINATAAQLDKTRIAGYIMVVEERTFTETTGPGTYTATVAIPAGATVYDVVWRNTALWTAAESATLNVGNDADSDGWFAAVDVKTSPAADDAAGVGGLSAYQNDSGAGVFGGKTIYSAEATTITATVVTVGATGDAGRSRLAVIYGVPVATEAVKTT